ncbi:MAG: hypothetical protein KC466_16420, partial [Myxococcales bacterium]|nr:hypothetical protein [Myxococcales bacterium]
MTRPTHARWMIALAVAASAAPLARADETPRILSAYFGCDGCIGLADENGDGSIVDEALAGGHNVVALSDGTLVTSAASQAAATLLCLGQANPRYLRNLDGMPVTFSAEVAGTPHAWAFEIELSDGTRRAPLCATLAPAAEENEDRTVLLIGEFGGPMPRGCEPARAPWPVAVRVVGDLFLEGTDAPQSATGAEYSGRFLDLRGGPEIVAARLAP